MRRKLRALGLVSALVVPCGLAACGGGAGDTWDDGFSGEPEGYAVAVFQRVNEERAAAGLAPLRWHQTASVVAREHAIDMDERSFFSHVNPDGMDAGDRLASAGVAFRRVGENLATGQDDPDEVMASWMASDAHRTNILNPLFTEIGIGVHGSTGGTWWTQDFFSP
jgi:uncharacterized protein YkwD